MTLLRHLYFSRFLLGKTDKKIQLTVIKIRTLLFSNIIRRRQRSFLIHHAPSSNVFCYQVDVLSVTLICQSFSSICAPCFHPAFEKFPRQRTFSWKKKNKHEKKLRVWGKNTSWIREVACPVDNCVTLS